MHNDILNFKFYFQTFVTEFFRLKKEIPEKSQKNLGGNPVYMPKKDPCGKTKLLKSLFLWRALNSEWNIGIICPN